VSQVSWFRDYGAYCGVTPSGKSLYAVVAQVRRARLCWLKNCLLSTRRAVPTPSAARGMAARAPAHHIPPHRQGAGELRYRSGSAVLVEDAGDEPETPAATPEAKPKQ